MSTLLVNNADIVITMDAQRRKIRGGGLFVRDNVIEQIGRQQTRFLAMQTR